MTTPNVALLRQTLAHIEANPDEWNQRHWRCGTGMCFAGWAATLAGGQWYEDDQSVHRDELIAEDGDTGEYDHGGVITVHVDDRARRILGLDEGQAERLFDAVNNLHDLRRIVGELTEDAAR